MNQELSNILWTIWELSIGLNKTIFKWNKSPRELIVLAGTDTSGLVRWCGQEYYIAHDWISNSIIINKR